MSCDIFNDSTHMVQFLVQKAGRIRRSEGIQLLILKLRDRWSESYCLRRVSPEKQSEASVSICITAIQELVGSIFFSSTKAKPVENVTQIRNYLLRCEMKLIKGHGTSGSCLTMGHIWRKKGMSRGP